MNKCVRCGRIKIITKLTHTRWEAGEIENFFDDKSGVCEECEIEMNKIKYDKSIN